MVDFNLGVPKDRWFPHWGRIAVRSDGRGRIAEQSSAGGGGLKEPTGPWHCLCN